MALNWSPAQGIPAYSVISGTETVTYTPKGGSPASVPSCLRRVQSQDHTGPGNLDVREMVWHVWAANLPAGVVPQIRDSITDAKGVVWLVERAEYQSKLTRYRLTCKQAR